MNQKSIIAVLGVVVVILIGTTVYFATINMASQPVVPATKVVQQPVPTPTPTVQQSTQPTAPSFQPTNETASWQTYTNAQYGFSLQIPMNWKGYEVKCEPVENAVVALCDFNLPKWPSAFEIEIYTPGQWSKRQNTDQPFAGEVIGKNNKYVYIFSQAPLLAGGNLPENDDVLAAQLKEVESIKKTFKIVQ